MQDLLVDNDTSDFTLETFTRHQTPEGKAFITAVYEKLQKMSKNTGSGKIILLFRAKIHF